jgi:hypothetical protein
MNKMNKWNIPDWLEQIVKNRDKHCIYCHIKFGKLKKSQATWEHIINDARIITPENIAKCCFSCNASKGSKKLSVWLESDYCKKRGINRDTIADIAKNVLAKEK